MFIEVLTRDDEKVSVNISQIVSVMPHYDGSIIFDSNEIFYELVETYESVMGRIYDLITPCSLEIDLVCDKTSKMYKNI